MQFPKIFQLTTMFVEDKGLTLEGNGGLNPKNTLAGAAFMSPQKSASGEMWKAIPLDNGYFQLTTAFVEDKELTLEGNGGYDSKNTLDGAAFMSPQKGASGEMWKVISLDNGYFQLTTMFVEDKGLVLEGNGGYDPKNALGGAAFMSPQKDASGTMWKVIPVKYNESEMTISGLVTAITNGTDGYTATIQTKEKGDYTALVSIFNLGRDGGYQGMNIGDQATLLGNVLFGQHLVVSQIISVENAK